MLKKIIRKLKEGFLREMIAETKWIYGYTSGYKRAEAVYILLGLLSTAAGLASGVASKYLIDAVVGRDTAVIGWVAGAYLALGTGRIGLSAVIRRFSAKVSVRASNEIRADVFRRFLDVDWQASLEYHSGDLLTRVNSDVQTVADSVLGWIPSLMTSTVQFAATLAVILAYDPVMALIAFVSAPVSVFLSRFFVTKMREFGRKMRDTQAEMTAFYEEALQNLQAVKAFDLKAPFASRLDALQEIYRGVSLDYNLFSVKSNLVMSACGLAVSCLCLFWGVYRLWSGYISFGTMVLFIQLTSLGSSSFSSLVSLVPSAVSATVSARRIMTIVSLPAEDTRATEETEAFMQRARENGVSVMMKDVSFSYNDGRRVFSGLELRAGPGEIIGIVSPSGGGKTTLIRLLLGLITPDSGGIYFESGGLSERLGTSMRGLVTYVAQEKVVFSGRISETLRLTNRTATDTELERALRLACAWDFVSALPEGMETRLGERGSGLSEGQIQRLAIARAILSSAPVMLLDEATSALDFKTEKQVLSNILSGDIRRTVIITTHRTTVLPGCARVYALENGKAVLLDGDTLEAFIKEGNT